MYCWQALRGNRGKNVWNYLVEARGFNPSAIGKTPLGYYTTPNDVRTYLLSIGLTPSEVDASGACGDERWCGRIICPVRDHRAQIVTFFSRDPSKDSTAPDRYLFLEGGRKPVLFGLDVALMHEGREDLNLVEGLLDVVAFQSQGFSNSAAIGGHGRHLTARRWEALASLGIRKVTLLLDNDQGGREGTTSALENLRHASRAPAVYVVDPIHLGSAKDPEEYVRSKGMTALLALLNKRVLPEAFQESSTV